MSAATRKCLVCFSARVAVCGERVDCVHCGASIPMATVRRVKALRRAVKVQELPAVAEVAAGPSDRGFAFADWFRGLLPDGTILPARWRESWASVFDKLRELDGRTEKEIVRVCKAGRAHEFWRKNFLTPLKLRDKDGNGMFYFDRIAAAVGPAKAAAVSRFSVRDAARNGGLGA